MDKTIKERILEFKLYVIIIIAVVILALISIISFKIVGSSKSKKASIITVSTLEKIIDVSELSTFTAVYNGIAEVMNEKKTDEIDYYVSYESKVNAGIDFEKLIITVDDEQNEKKIIKIKIPAIYITEVNVDIESLDFIFFNDKANQSTVVEQAFKACEKDAIEESEQQGAIYDLAKQNTINVLTALTKPIIDQLDDEYQLIIE